MTIYEVALLPARLRPPFASRIKHHGGPLLQHQIRVRLFGIPVHACVANKDLQLHRGHRARLPQCAAHQRQLQQPDTVREHRR
jgi:hypothetical protein